MTHHCTKCGDEIQGRELLLKAITDLNKPHKTTFVPFHVACYLQLHRVHPEPATTFCEGCELPILIGQEVTLICSLIFGGVLHRNHVAVFHEPCYAKAHPEGFNPLEIPDNGVEPIPPA